jgi:hypothetical protein
MRRLLYALAIFATSSLLLAPQAQDVTATGTITDDDDAGSDWFADETARLTTLGALVEADRLDTQAIIDDWYFNDATGDHMSLDEVLIPPGDGVGSLKHEILNSDAAASGQFSVPLGQTFTEGDRVIFAYQVYFQPEEKYAPWPPGNDATGTASKLSILSRDANGASPTGSNQLNEFVFQQNYTGGRISAYHRDTATNFPPIAVNDNNVCSSTDVIDNPDLDRGAGLSSTDPDDGTAWSSCEQYRAQYASLHYSARTSPGAANYKQGLGDPFSVDFAPAGEWITVQGALEIGSFGGSVADTRALGMVAREGGPWVLLFDEMIDLGAGPDYNGLNLLPYTTARTSGGRQVSSRTGELASCFDIWNVGPTHATGSGTLSWNSSTLRMTWQASGDSAGTARGYSAANDVLAVNLISSTSANFLNGQFTPASCPGGNTTETVTIATDRPDTQRNYANVIVSTAMINAPDGSPPPVGFDSDLKVLADSMVSGDWQDFTMGGLDDALLHASSSAGTQSHVTFVGRMHWDSTTKKLYYLGFGHCPGGCDDIGAYFTWDDETNQFSTRENYTTTGRPNLGESHVYMMWAHNEATQDSYWRNYFSNTIRKFVSLAATEDFRDDWETGHVADKPTGGNQINGALEWYQPLNSGSGGLAFFDVAGGYWTNAALSSWSDTYTANGNTAFWSGDYDQNVAQAGGYLYFGGGTCVNVNCTGGGNGDTTRHMNLYRMDSTGDVTQLGDLPRTVSQNSSSSNAVMLPHPNGTDLLILPMAASGTIYLYDPDMDDWNTHGTTEFTEGIMHVCGVIDDYDVILCFTHGSSETTAYAQVYKP